MNSQGEVLEIPFGHVWMRKFLIHGMNFKAIYVQRIPLFWLDEVMGGKCPITPFQKGRRNLKSRVPPLEGRGNSCFLPNMQDVEFLF